jgi:small redox-active disulfide protein 2
VIIKVLGSGCANCQKLETATRAALVELGLDAKLEHVTDPGQIASYGVMRTPALVVDDEVVLSGRVPTISTVTALLAARG